MKTATQNCLGVLSTALWACLSLFAFNAGAAVWFWDPNGLSAPTSGTWDTITPQWATSSVLTASPVVWGTANAAGFPAGAANVSTYTITVNSAISCGGIFNGNSLANNTGFGVTNLILSGSGSLSINSGLQGFWTGSNAWNTLIRVPLTGSGGLQNQSQGSLFLSGANSYGGGTSVGTSAGLNFNNGSAFGTGTVTNAVSTSVLATPATDSSGATFATAPITIANAWQTFGGTSSEIFVGLAAAPVTFTGPWTLTGAAATTTTLDMRNTTFTISGVVSGAANLTKINATGTLVLSGANTYSGKTVVGGGTLSVSSLNKVSGGSASSNLGHPTTAPNGTIGLGATTTAGTLLYTGAGETTDRVIDMAGTTGGATIQNNGSGALHFTSAFTATGSGAKTLTLTGSYTSTANIIDGAVVNSASGASPLTVSGGSWTLNGVDTFTGATTVNSGATLTVGGAGQLGSGAYAGQISCGGTFNFNSSANQTLSGALGSNGTFNQNGTPGTLTLSGASTFTGNIHLNPGSRTAVGVLGCFGASGSTVNLDGGTFGNNSGTGKTITPGVNLNINADFTFDDSFFPTGANGQVAFNGGTATLKNGNRTFNIDQPNGQTVNLGITSPIGQDVAGRSLIKIGSGILALNGANTYSGSTTISNGQITINGTSTLGDGTGTFRLYGGRLSTSATRTASTAPVANPIDVIGDNAIQTVSIGATVDFNLSSSTIGGSAGTLTFSNAAPSGTGVFQPRFSGSGFNFSLPIIIANGGAAGTTKLQSFNTTGTDQTFSGPISGNGSFNRTASTTGTGGRTIFSAAAGNSYSGGTTVGDGTLLVSNTSGSGTGSGAVAVNSSGTLAGNGIISGPVGVSSGGILSPGTSGIGILTINNTLTLAGNATMEIDRGNVPTSDLATGMSTVTYGGTLTVVNLGAAPQAGDCFTLFTASSYASSFASLVLPALNPGLAWVTSGLGSSGTICVSNLPVVSVSPASTNAECGTTLTLTAIASGTGNLTYQWYDTSSNSIAGATNAAVTVVPQTGTYTVVVTDSIGSSSASATVTTVDTTPPVITCATNKTVECGSSWSFDAPTAFDLCCGSNVTVSVLNTITNGTQCSMSITRTWLAVDCSSLSNTCSQTVTVTDTTPPVITCSSNKTVNLGDTWSFDEPSASDVCCGTNVTVVVLNTVTNGDDCALLITQTWQATDCCSNSATCSQTVTVIDVPSLTCSSNKTVECGSNWSFDEPVASDAICTNLTVTILSTVTNGSACSQVITRTWDVENCCSNHAGCSQTVTVSDTTPPVITCSSNKVVECGSVWDFDAPSASDVCCGTNVTILDLGTVTNGTGCALVITKTWQATDCCSNSASCSQTVTVVDTTPPVITCSSNKVVECGSVWDFDAPSASDICCGTNVTITVSGTITNGSGCALTITRTWQAMDCCSNSASCSQTVTVADTTPPVITCSSNKVVECGSVWDFDAPSASDVCCGSNVTITVSGTITNGEGCSLTITRSWQATDCCSNSASCSQTVTVVDTTPPVITCSSNKTVNLGDAWSFDDPSASDTCCGTNVTVVVLNTVTNGDDCALLITQTWQATDCCSNSATCSQTVTIIDVPSLTCSSNKTVECGSNWSFDEPVTSDAICTNLTLTIVSTVTNGTGCSLSITRTWDVENCCSNHAGCSQTVTVVDTTPPVITCSSNKVVECGSVWDFDAPSASDVCCGTNVTVIVSGTVTNGTACSLAITRTWQATDCCSNSASCSQTVTVVDTTPPVITCATNKSVPCSSSWSFDAPSASDVCCGSNVTISVVGTVTNGTGCTQIITRTWQATDCCTNSAICSQTVTVVSPDCAPVQITGLSYSGTTFTLQFVSVSCVIYDVEYKNNLTDPSWSLLETDPGTGGTIIVQDTLATPSNRFYRVICHCH